MGKLSLSRKNGEKIIIITDKGEKLELKSEVARYNDSYFTRLYFKGSNNFKIFREELYNKIQADNASDGINSMFNQKQQIKEVNGNV
jgi:sRNA-binding carbon storage regulator CsrA